MSSKLSTLNTDSHKSHRSPQRLCCPTAYSTPLAPKAYSAIFYQTCPHSLVLSTVHTSSSGHLLDVPLMLTEVRHGKQPFLALFSSWSKAQPSPSLLAQWIEDLPHRQLKSAAASSLTGTAASEERTYSDRYWEFYDMHTQSLVWPICFVFPAARPFAGKWTCIIYAGPWEDSTELSRLAPGRLGGFGWHSSTQALFSFWHKNNKFAVWH